MVSLVPAIAIVHAPSLSLFPFCLFFPLSWHLMPVYIPPSLSLFPFCLFFHCPGISCRSIFLHRRLFFRSASFSIVPASHAGLSCRPSLPHRICGSHYCHKHHRAPVEFQRTPAITRSVGIGSTGTFRFSVQAIYTTSANITSTITIFIFTTRAYNKRIIIFTSRR